MAQSNILNKNNIVWDDDAKPAHQPGQPHPVKEEIEWDETPSIDWERIGYQTLGGMVGGALTGGNPMGIGLGSSMAGQVSDLIKEKTGQRPPEPLLKRSKTAAEDFLLDVISPVALSKGLYGVKKIGRGIFKGPVTRLHQPAGMARHQKFGTRPSAGAATRSGALQRTEAALAQYPFSTRPLTINAQYNVEQLKTATEVLAREYGDVLSREEIGVLLKSGAKGVIEGQDKIWGKLFSRLAKDIGDQPVSINNTKEMLITLVKESQVGPSSGIGDLAQEVVKKARTGGGGLPWESIKKFRTKIGDMMRDPYLVTTRNIQQGDLKRLYGALTQDMEEAALRAGPKVHARWRAANKYFEVKITRDLPIIEAIMKKQYPEEVLDLVMQSSRKGASRLRLLRKQLGKKEWNALAGTTIENLGRATPGMQDASGGMFSIRTFLTNWNRLSFTAKKTLFGGTKHAALWRDLDDLARVASDFKELDRLANTSNTGSVLSFFSLMSAFGGVAGGAMGGIQGAAQMGATAGTLSLAPYGIAKLLTNSKFVRWAANGFKIAKANPSAMSTHLGRLMVLRMEEDVKPYLDELISKGILNQE